MKKVKSLGICFGASSIKVVELIKDEDTFSIGKKLIINHEKNPLKSFQKLINDLDLSNFDHIALTGRNFKDKIKMRSITEPEALEYALSFLFKDNNSGNPYKAIASLGAENFIVYHLDKHGYINKIETENKCASGTGEFFLQQISRINIEPEDAINLALNSEEHKIAGRCSVYCKSDCTHALNTGVPIGNVVAGLSKMMSDKILFLLQKIKDKKIIAVGGVTKNQAVMNNLKKDLDTLYIPENADVFEAIGASYFAFVNEVEKDFDINDIFKLTLGSYTTLPPINKNSDLVEFKEIKRDHANKDDECILGLDVGSTTTKAVLLRTKDNAVIASIYLRTNGDPVQASINCYKDLDKQINHNINIIGLGVTGSGRQIAGLHALTDGIINEIIAHSTGAAFFDNEVDTIFEIGGQDAKYIYLLNGVPIDYAMNEACSAGTGSFLEEAIKNNFSIDYRDIEKVALNVDEPPNFNDQCSAFINSDIKTAIQENISGDEIVAGLVYSICQNYLNKVKSQRPIGKKIYMQGGVCYNKAIPLAMANLLNKKIIVPPEPGLVGAFGVALEIKDRINNGLLDRSSFDLKELYNRNIEYGKKFRCTGRTENCDRNCEINMLIINENKYPFGGACNKYYNQIHKNFYDFKELEYVRHRENLVFNKYAQSLTSENVKTIGINRSFLTHMLYPLFYNFFEKLGLKVVLPDNIDEEGIKTKNASFCYPVDISHGFFSDLLRMDTDYIFLPKITELYVENSVSYTKEHNCACLLLQSEAYLLNSAFSEQIKKEKMISPELNFSQGFETQINEFIKIAEDLGRSPEEAANSYSYALEKFKEYQKELKNKGNEILKEIEQTGKIGIVVFGRPYNALSKDLNFGIPEKIASRGYYVIPWDYLPFENEPCDQDMCWAMGQNLIKTSHYVKKHPNLYGAYITNFSCGPDSFLIGYFRDIMKNKPSLTLELDSHTADAGINTRIEAFLDVIERYKNIEVFNKTDTQETFSPAYMEFEGPKSYFIDSDNNKYSFFDKNVHLLIPSIGEYASDILAAAFKSVGINTSPLPPYDVEDLKIGRENTIGKECLPMILIIGGLLKHLENNRKEGEKIVYFMPSNPGNCRFTQYSVFINNLIKKKKIKDVALLSLSPENSYAGIPITGMLTFLKGVIISDVMEDIKNTLKVLAVDKEKALSKIEIEWKKISSLIRSKGSKGLYKILTRVSKELKKIPLKRPLNEAKKIALLGDFFARRDDFSCQGLIDKLADKGIIVKREHIYGWFNYVDYLVDTGILESNFNLMEKIQFAVKQMLQNSYEKKIKKILSRSGLYDFELVDMPSILEYGNKFFDKKYTGEQILVVGNFFKDILNTVHGAISIGPFACMPMKIVEAILTKESTMETKNTFDISLNKKIFYDTKEIDNLPFLAIESDGNPYPQIVEAKIEAFCLQIDRLHKKLST